MTNDCLTWARPQLATISTTEDRHCYGPASAAGIVSMSAGCLLDHNWPQAVRRPRSAEKLRASTKGDRPWGLNVSQTFRLDNAAAMMRHSAQKARAETERDIERIDFLITLRRCERDSHSFQVALDSISGITERQIMKSLSQFETLRRMADKIVTRSDATPVFRCPCAGQVAALDRSLMLSLVRGDNSKNTPEARWLRGNQVCAQLALADRTPGTGER